MEVDRPLRIDTDLPNDVARVNVDPLYVYYPFVPAACWPLPSLAAPGRNEERGPEEPKRGRSPDQEESTDDIPTRTEVGSIYPNPTEGSFSIPLAVSRDRAGRFEIAIFDVSGRRVATLAERVLPAGRHLVKWDGSVAAGARAAAGIYFLRIEAAEFEHTTKLVLLE
jgi:hypothetical protein